MPIEDCCESGFSGGVAAPGVVGAKVSGQIAAHLQMWRLSCGMEIEHVAARRQQRAGTLKGIDHALDRQSSQRPGKDHDVERLRRQDEVFEPDRANVHSRAGHIGATRFDGVLIGIDGED